MKCHMMDRIPISLNFLAVCIVYWQNNPSNRYLSRGHFCNRHTTLFMHSHKVTHWNDIIHLWWNIKGAPHLGINQSNSLHAVGCKMDFDWADSQFDRRSNFGYCTIVEEIEWSTEIRQNMVKPNLVQKKRQWPILPVISYEKIISSRGCSDESNKDVL